MFHLRGHPPGTRGGIGPEQLHSAKVSGLSRTSCQPQAWGREVESTLMGGNRDPGPHGLVLLDDTGPKV